MDRIRTARVASVLHRAGLPAIAAATLLGFSSAPAAADFCLQLNGGDFSGDIGFFRFDGPLPPGKPNSMVPMAGRAAGTGEPVFGGAVINADGTSFQLGATFFIDNVQGQFSLGVSSVTKTGSGHGRYGAYDIGGSSFQVKIVNCNKEPNQ
jgi:hypothetical protein